MFYYWAQEKTDLVGHVYLAEPDFSVREKQCDYFVVCAKPTDARETLMKATIIQSNELERVQVRADDDPSVRWNGAFVLYGGAGTTQSSTIVYEIEPGGRLGWHTDATEETQYIIAGRGELHLEDGTVHNIEPGSVFVLPTPLRHDLVNTGSDTLRAVAFFAAAMFTQSFDNVMLPPRSHVLGTPNRNG